MLQAVFKNIPATIGMGLRLYAAPLGDCGDPDKNLALPFPDRNSLVGTLMAIF